MLDVLSRIVWILFGLVAGYLLRKRGAAKAEDGALIFRIIFYICVPALVFGSLATIHVTHHLLIFSALCAALYAVGFVVGKVAVSRVGLSPLRKPIFLVATMGVNSVFALPFLQSLYGSQGVARYIAYDAVNTILLYSWAYSITVKANSQENVLLSKLLKSPPLYAVVFGLVVNLLGVHLPTFVTTTATSFGAPTAFLVTLAIGISIDPQRENVGISLLTVALRTISAVIIGVAFILIFDLHGIDRVAVMLFCVAPLAFSCATFAALENLDVRFASEMLSISLVIGIVISMLCVLALV